MFQGGNSVPVKAVSAGELIASGGNPDTLLARYSYDGKHRRIRKVVDPNDTDISYDYYYNLSWQVLEVRKEDDVDPLKQYVWSTRYIDSPIVRFYNGNTDGTVDDTLYYTTDANMNVTALVDLTSGCDVVERYIYDAYGRVTVLNGAAGADGDAADDEWGVDGSGTDWNNEVLYAAYSVLNATDPYGLELSLTDDGRRWLQDWGLLRAAQLAGSQGGDAYVSSPALALSCNRDKDGMRLNALVVIAESWTVSQLVAEYTSFVQTAHGAFASVSVVGGVGAATPFYSIRLEARAGYQWSHSIVGQRGLRQSYRARFRGEKHYEGMVKCVCDKATGKWDWEAVRGIGPAKEQWYAEVYSPFGSWREGEWLAAPPASADQYLSENIEKVEAAVIRAEEAWWKGQRSRFEVPIGSPAGRPPVTNCHVQAWRDSTGQSDRPSFLAP